METGLTESTLAEVCSLVTDGTHDTPKRVASGFPLIKAKEITGGRIDFENCDQISEEEHLEVIARSKPEFGDTLFAHIGASLGEAAFVNTTREFSIKNVALFKPNPAVIDARYLYYLVISPAFQSLAKGTKTGSAQPFLGLGQLRGHSIQFHRDKVTQRRIGAILSAYDELMENSQRRIRLLEAMARALYREWFVHFRFPGHEKHPRIASPLGDIPQGWEVKPFTEIAHVLSGGTPKTDVAEYWDGEIPFFTPHDVPDCFYVQDTDKHTNELGISKCASELYPPDTVFITARGTVGKVALPSVPMAMNQSCYALRGKPGIPQRFLFLMTLQQVDYLKTNTGGATFDTIVVDTFRRMNVVAPALDIVARFAKKTDSIFEQVNTLQRQIQNLRRTRDLLLPRLLSGQIEVGTNAA
jgi:type I restriction enzyme, S subunit